jgi:hypothetical protein
MGSPDPRQADAVALRRLLHAYCHRIDNGTAAAIAALFHPAGVLHLGFIPRRPDQAGRSGIAAWFDGYMATTRRESAHNRHRIGLVALAMGADTAVARSWWDASGIRRATGALHLLRGHYVDAFARDGGRWCFVRREIHLMDERIMPAVRRQRPAAPPPGRCVTAWTGCPPSLEGPAMPSAPPDPRHDWLCGEGIPVPDAAEAEDTVALEQLLNRLCLVLSGDRPGELAGLLLPEAVLVTDRRRLDEEVRGSEAICVWHAAELRDGRPGRLAALVPIVRVAGDEAEILAYSTAETCPGAGGMITVAMGRLELALRREAGRWRIARLVELRFFAYDAGVAGTPAASEFP